METRHRRRPGLVCRLLLHAACRPQPHPTAPHLPVAPVVHQPADAAPAPPGARPLGQHPGLPGGRAGREGWCGSRRCDPTAPRLPRSPRRAAERSARWPRSIRDRRTAASPKRCPDRLAQRFPARSRVHIRSQTASPVHRARSRSSARGLCTCRCPSRSAPKTWMRRGARTGASMAARFEKSWRST